MRQPAPTSSQLPDLAELRTWLEEMITAMRFVELVIAIIGLIGRMRDINLELSKRIAYLTRRRPRAESLDRLERQLTLPLGELLSTVRDAQNAAERAKSRRRSARAGGRGKFPDHLQRIDFVNPVPPAQRICPLCGSVMHTVGHSVCERIAIEPAKFIVQRRLDETVACPNDETIVSAAPPPAIVERGMLADSLIVEATSDKYLEHQPIERQCSRFARDGVKITAQTLRRAVSAHLDLLAPIARAIADRTRGPGLLGTDATSIPILDPDAPDNVRNGAMWCWTNARWVTFFYSPNGDSASVRRFLGEDLARTVQCDGTTVTTFLERAGGKRPGCWSHARRGFVDAARGGDQVALEALHKMAPLFAIERESKLAGDDAQQRLARRRQHSQSVIDDIQSFLTEQRALVPPKTPLGRALGYLHRQWKRLVLFLDDGNIELTNNRLERELRRLVLGRKNWLFTWLDVGGERTATILTIIATCIAHEINPRAYLHVATKRLVEGWPQADLLELLPDRIVTLHPELLLGAPQPEKNALPGPA